MDDLLKKFYDGTIDPEEFGQLRSKVTAMGDEELGDVLDRRYIPFPDLPDPDTLRRNIENGIKKDRRRRYIRKILTVSSSVAAAVIICIFSWMLMEHIRKTSKYEDMIVTPCSFRTGNGEKATVKLPDGSTVELGPASLLSYRIEDFNSERRTVAYRGEGRFSIAKNKGKFTVYSDLFSITVLGTEFSVLSRGGRDMSEIFLEEGSIELATDLSGERRILRPGQTAFIDRSTGKISISGSDKGVSVGKDVICFSSERLSKVARELEIYYGKKFLVSEEVMGNRFTGTLPTNDLDDVIFILERTLNVGIKNLSDNTYVIE